jgi:tetratricopeptide (TPR) repeat protein
MSSRGTISWILLLAIVATGAVYWPGRGGGFVFDDVPNIVENRAIAVADFRPVTLAGAAFSSDAGTLSRPIPMFTLTINHAFAGLDPAPYKLTNIAIHLLAVLATFFLARVLLRAARLAGIPGVPDRADIAALFLAALFALHPMQLTSVLYVVQRMTSLAGLFVYCGLICYVAARTALWQGRKQTLLFFAGPAAFTVLAALSKENGALLPLFALAIEATVFRFRDSTGRCDRRVVVWHLTFTLLPVLAGLMLFALDWQRFLGGYVTRPFTLYERLLTEARALVFYARNLIAPSISQLGLYHDDFAVSRGLLSPLTTPLAVAAVAVSAWAAWLARNRAPLVTLGILWFLIGHLLESTILPLELVHEHRNYVPVFGFGLLLIGTAGLAGNLQLPRAVRLGVPVAFVLALAMITAIRAHDWGNPYLHADSEIRHHPQSARAVYEAGRLYANLAMRGNAQALDAALEHMARASQLDPANPTPDIARILLASKLSLSIDDVWVQTTLQKYRDEPPPPAAIMSLKHLVRCSPRKHCLRDDQLAPILQAAYRNRYLGTRARARADISSVYGEYLINARGDFAAGEEKFREAVQLVPGETQYRVNLINLLIAGMHADEAAAELGRLRALRRPGAGRQIERLAADISNLRVWLARQARSG